MDIQHRLQIVLKIMTELRLSKVKKELKETEEKLRKEKEEKQLLQRQLKEKEEFVIQLQRRLEDRIFELLKVAELTHNRELLAMKAEHEREIKAIQKMLEQVLEEGGEIFLPSVQKGKD